MSLVLDSSVALAAIYPGEATVPVRAVFERVIRSGAWVPSLWRLEVANSLQLAAKKGRIPQFLRDEALVDLRLLPIRIDPETDRSAWGATLELAVAHSLTTYDAAYLELAIRRHLPIASLDAALLNAARATGVTTLGL